MSIEFIHNTRHSKSSKSKAQMSNEIPMMQCQKNPEIRWGNWALGLGTFFGIWIWAFGISLKKMQTINLITKLL